MKKVIVIFITLMIIVSFIGCATQTITIMTEPDDSKIYVDGEYLGKGEISFNAGLEYTIPQSHNIQITHKDFNDFQTVIKNKLDVKRASFYTGLMCGLGILSIILHYNLYEPPYYTDKTLLYLGYGYMAISPIYFLVTYKFNDFYKYDLKE